MKTAFFLVSVLVFLNTGIYGQLSPIVLTESTLKIGGLSTEESYFGFTEGDQIVFDFNEINNKELKEIEIVELPSSSKFFEYKAININSKIINVTSTGIYKFRFYNSALGGRLCKFKIQRIPSSENTKSFNSNVYWKTLYDTSWHTVQEKYLISRDTSVIPVIPHRIERVHSQTSTNGLPNKTTLNFTLPANTISWSYYIGVGESAEAVFKQAEEKAAKSKSNLSAASGLASGIAYIDPTGSAALASLALKGLADFSIPEKADNIQYWFVRDFENAQLFMNAQQFYMFDKGDGPVCTKRITQPLLGTLYLCLLNDNLREGIDVHLRISAVTVNEKWGIRDINKFNVKTRKEPYLKN